MAISGSFFDFRVIKGYLPKVTVKYSQGKFLGGSGFRKRGRRNGVASDFFPFFSRFLPFCSVSFRFSSVVFRFLPFFSVLFRFFRFIFRKKKKRGDTVRETPFAKPRVVFLAFLGKKSKERKIRVDSSPLANVATSGRSMAW